MARGKAGDVRQEIVCPRCGYDVTGAMSTWADRCAVEGLCTECGFEFQWRHLLGKSREIPKWFYETARRRVFRRTLMTPIRAVAPWRFWRAVPLHAPFAPRRMASMVALWIVIAYGASVVAATTVDLAMALFPTVPAASYYYPSWQSRSYSYGVVSRQPPPAFWARVTSWGTHDLPPVALWPVRDDGESGVARGQARVVLIGVTAMALMPVSFLALSGTLAKHKVRRMHIVRGSMVAIGVTLNAVALWFVAGIARMVLEVWFPGDWFVFDGAIAFVGTQLILWWPVILMVWWWMVCRRYLRIRHAFWTGVLMTVLAFLMALLVLFPITFDGFFWLGVMEW